MPTPDGPFRPGASTFSTEGFPTLAALDGPALPWDVGSMTASNLEHLCARLDDSRATRVLELGSGVSTVLLARLLRRRGAPDARLVSIEHDPGWARWVTERLRAEGATDGVTVVHTPLVSSRRTALPWYDEDVLTAGVDRAFAGDPLDFLIIDGPPAYEPGLELARYPAVPVLVGRMAPGAPVYLDDTDRAGEQRVMRRWEAETPLRFVPVDGTRLARAMVPEPGRPLDGVVNRPPQAG